MFDRVLSEILNHEKLLEEPCLLPLSRDQFPERICSVRSFCVRWEMRFTYGTIFEMCRNAKSSLLVPICYLIYGVRIQNRMRCIWL